MAFDDRLADRIRQVFGARRDIAERKMFGGLAFLLRGRMCFGIVGSDLIVRVSDDEYETIVRKPHVRPMDFTGRPLSGMVYVAPAGLTTDAALAKWVQRGIDFVSTRMAKKSETTPRKPRRTPAK